MPPVVFPSYTPEQIQAALGSLPAEAPMEWLQDCSKNAFNAAIVNNKSVPPLIIAKLCADAGSGWLSTILAFLNLDPTASLVLLNAKVVFFLGLASAAYYEHIKLQKAALLEIDVYKEYLVSQSQLLAVYYRLNRLDLIKSARESAEEIAAILNTSFGPAETSKIILQIADYATNNAYSPETTKIFYKISIKYLLESIINLEKSLHALSAEYFAPAFPPAHVRDDYPYLLNELATVVSLLRGATNYLFQDQNIIDEKTKDTICKFITTAENLVKQKQEVMKLQDLKRKAESDALRDAFNNTVVLESKAHPTLRRRKPAF